MKHFRNIRKQSIFFLAALIFLVQGKPVSIYAHEYICVKLPDGKVGEEYSQKLEKPKNLKNPIWTLKSEADLPGGLNISPNGYLVGTPKDAEKEEYIFEVNVCEKDDKSNCTIYKLSLKIKKKIKTEEKEWEYAASETFRLISGYELTKASSADKEEKAFIDLYLSQPLPVGFNKKKKRWRVWGNARLTSVPQTNDKNIGIVGSTNYFGGIETLKLNQITHAAEFLVGLDIRLCKLKEFRTDETDDHIKEKTDKTDDRILTLGIILAAGGITPITPDKDSIPIFKISEGFKKQYPDEEFTDETKYVAFIPPTRNRFYHQYYVGIRLKTYYNKNNYKNDNVPPPAMFDVAWGLNDAASAGKGHFFKRPVVRLDGFMPFRIGGLHMYLFGTVVLNTTKETVEMPQFLEPAPDGTTLHDPNLKKLQLPENDRDYYRIGIGVDLSSLLQKKE